MRNKILFSFFAFMFCAGNIIAFETSDFKPYAAVKAGAANMSSSVSYDGAAGSYDLNSSQPVFLFGVSIGTKFKSLRGEFDYTYHSVDNLDFPANGKNFEGKHENQMYLFNFYYDFISDKTVYPYIGAGLGWTRTYVDFSKNTEDVKEAALFTYSLAAGLTYNLSRYIDLDLGYRYVKISDKDVNGADAVFKQHAGQLFLAGRYKF